MKKTQALFNSFGDALHALNSLPLDELSKKFDVHPKVLDFNDDSILSIEIKSTGKIVGDFNQSTQVKVTIKGFNTLAENGEEK